MVLDGGQGSAVSTALGPPLIGVSRRQLRFDEFDALDNLLAGTGEVEQQQQQQEDLARYA